MKTFRGAVRLALIAADTVLSVWLLGVCARMLTDVFDAVFED